MFGQIHAVRCLLLRNIIPCPLIIDPDEALRIAAEHKHMDIVELLLNSCYFNPDCYNLTILTQACKVGHEPIVKHMLTLLETRLSDINLSQHVGTSPNVLPPALCLELSDAVNAACEFGHAGILRLFLIHGVNVSKQALRKAAEGGHQDVVEILLDTDQVDPIQGLFAASLKGHVEIVKLLLDRYPNISLKDIEASFYDATKEGHVGVMKLLLDAMTVGTDQLHVQSLGLKYASMYSHEKAVEFILACQGVNPSANNNAAMEAAIKAGSIGIVRMLIETKRLRISSCVAENMVRVAEDNGYVEISKILRSL
ncbi:ankyrin repeat-containing domain protein [Chytridium lagenaria]|nr:ankyrin repeat-containing domain protein [Chytridium lagenaria]